MKQFACGDVVPGCTAVFRAETEPEILALVAEHAKSGHEMSQVPPALVEQVRSHITDAAA